MPTAVLFALLLGAAGSSPSLSFSRPAMLPVGHGPFFDPMRSLGPNPTLTQLAYSPGGFYGTYDGGKTWSTPFTVFEAADANNLSSPAENFTTFAVVDPATGIAHNMGAIEGGHLNNVTSVHANASGTFYMAVDGKFAKKVVNQSISFTGLPAPGIKGFRLGGADWVRLADGKTLIASIIVQWAYLGPSDKRASITSFKSTDGGYNWKFVGNIAKADKVSSNEGPNENNLALLNNGSVLCVMRLDAGDAGRYHRYATSVSNDEGVTWTTPTLMPGGEGSARPRLLAMGSAGLLLSGGRTWKKNRDTLVWYNAKGDAAEWIAYSISYYHNLYITNESYRFDPVTTNGSDHWPRESNSYSTVVKTGPASAYITYGLKGAYGFAMPIHLDP